MSWWHKMPADAGRRPEILAVGWAGFCTWRTLLGIDAQQDFAGRIPRRFTDPEYLWSQNPPDGPGAEIYADGLQRCLDKGLVAWDGNELVLEHEIYEDWRGAKSDRTRKHEERQRQRATKHVTSVTPSHECHAESQPSRDVTHVTPPDQTRPDQTRPDQTRPDQNMIPPPPAGARDPGSTEQRYGVRHGSDVFSQLYERHRAVVASVAPKGAVKLLGAVNVLHKIRECLNHPSVREQDQAAIERALELLGVQAKAKADAGESDPWWLLENAWSPGVLEKALACRDEDTARMRAVKRPRGGGGPMPPPTSQPPNSHEYFAELARQQQAEKESQNVPPDQTP